MEIRKARENEMNTASDLVRRCKLSTEYLEVDYPRLVAVMDGSIVAYSAFPRQDNSNWVYIQSLCVDPSYRRRGIAGQLLDYQRDLLKSDDVLIALTLFWNKKIYEGLGFKQANARELKVGSIGGRQKHLHCMGLTWCKPLTY